MRGKEAESTSGVKSHSYWSLDENRGRTDSNPKGPEVERRLFPFPFVLLHFIKDGRDSNMFTW